MHLTLQAPVTWGKKSLMDIGKKKEYLICSACFSPHLHFGQLRTLELHIGLYMESANFAVVSVCEAEHSPLWCGHLMCCSEEVCVV